MSTGEWRWAGHARVISQGDWKLSWRACRGKGNAHTRTNPHGRRVLAHQCPVVLRGAGGTGIPRVAAARTQGS